MGELIADERLVYEVNGIERSHDDLVRDWPFLWQSVVTEAEFNYLLALSRHCEVWDRSHPNARPERPIDPLTSPIPF